MKELEIKLRKTAEKLNFEELKSTLEKIKIPEARDIIMQVMEEKDQVKFEEWLEEY